MPVIPLPSLIIEPRVRGMCRLPYPGHPRGCPNFDHKTGCPPKCLSFGERFNLQQPLYAIVNEFDLGSHVERMRTAHPGWSTRQLECCLYWQQTARGQLADQIRVFLFDHPGYETDACPEAGGVNVTETMRQVGVILEWPPKRTVRHVAIAGLPLNSTQAVDQGVTLPLFV